MPGLKYLGAHNPGVHNIAQHCLLILCIYNSHTCVSYFNVYAEDFHTLASFKILGDRSPEYS